MVNIYDVINNQYPHRLYVRASEGEATQDEHGAWRPTPGGWKLSGPCREETNGRGNTIATAGGEFTTYSALVQIPQSYRERIPEGSEVAVADRDLTDNEIAALEDPQATQELVRTGVIRIAGKCLKYDAGRLHSRVWV